LGSLTKWYHKQKALTFNSDPNFDVSIYKKNKLMLYLKFTSKSIYCNNPI